MGFHISWDIRYKGRRATIFYDKAGAEWLEEMYLEFLEQIKEKIDKYGIDEFVNKLKQINMYGNSSCMTGFDIVFEGGSAPGEEGYSNCNDYVFVLDIDKLTFEGKSLYDIAKEDSQTSQQFARKRFI